MLLYNLFQTAGPKVELLAYKKSKFICLDSPYQPEIKIKYLKNFQD